MKKFTFTFFLMLFLSPLFLFAQTTEKCAADMLLKAAIAEDPTLIDKIATIEEETARLINSGAVQRGTGTVFTIPVVFHIIHNGEAIGDGDNVSDDLVQKQLNRLNEDFRLTNTDALPASHPFFGNQVDTEIQFCLAKRDPMGNVINGITRMNGNRPSWTIAQIDQTLKPTTIWNRRDYLNIWCINLQDPGSPGVDGYATFPADANDVTDGVVVASFAFGDDGGAKTIVATHEIGHYLNLIHIWGDDDCGDDMVNDTPTAEKSNEGCPNFPHNANSNCGTSPNGEMYMNYMDYSDAVCTVMFTQGQKERMQATLLGSRSSLISSTACMSPVYTEETALSQSLKVSPNPSKGNFTVNATMKGNSTAQVNIFNLLGHSLKQFNHVSFPFQAEATDLPNGTYIVRILNGQLQASSIVTIEN